MALTQEAMSEQVGCAVDTLRSVEAGRMRPSSQLAELFVAALGVPSDERADMVRWARAPLQPRSRAALPQEVDEPGTRLHPRGSAPSKESTPSNLISPLTQFIGRRQEREQVRALLWRAGIRLVTLTGPPGIGKTRLSIDVAASLLDDFDDGVWQVLLAPIADSSLVIPTIAHTLGLQEVVDHPLLLLLKEYLRNKRVLLLLDNFEHVTGASLELAALLAYCPFVKVLVTSREALHLPGEKVYEVPALRLPERHDIQSINRLLEVESVALFMERASDVKYGFALVPENSATIKDICCRLEGVPLAIELAAAMCEFLPVEQISKRLSDRFRLLVGGRSFPALPRHDSLLTAIDSSYDLLSEKERVLFLGLSVFAGGSSLEAVEAVCAGERVASTEIADLLRSLVDKSLVKANVQEQEARYTMLESIREYAALRLEGRGDQGALRAGYIGYYVALAESMEQPLRYGDQMAAIAVLEREKDNFRAVLQASKSGTSGKVEMGMRLAGALLHFWLLRGYLSEGREHLMALLRNADGPREEMTLEQLTTRGKAFNAAGGIVQTQGDLEEARILYERSLEFRRIVGAKEPIANTLSNLGNVAWLQGDYARARQLYQESLALRETNDKLGIAIALNNLGLVTWYEGDGVGARSLHKQSRALYAELNDRRGEAVSLNDLGNIEWFEGRDSVEARTCYESSLAIRRDLGDKAGVATSISDLARIDCTEGRFEEASAGWKFSLQLSQETGEKRTMVAGFMGLAWVQAAQGEAILAAQLLGAASGLSNAMGFKLRPVDIAEYEHTADLAIAILGETSHEVEWRRGYALPLIEAVRLALETTVPNTEV